MCSRQRVLPLPRAWGWWSKIRAPSHSFAAWPCTSHFPSLNLHFPIWKIRDWPLGTSFFLLLMERRSLNMMGTQSQASFWDPGRGGGSVRTLCEICFCNYQLCKWGPASWLLQASVILICRIRGITPASKSCCKDASRHWISRTKHGAWSEHSRQ